MDAGARATAQVDAGVRRVPTDPSAEDYPMPPLPRAKVILTDAYGGKHLVDVEVAANELARTRGLMWRKELPEGQGMLFVFQNEEPHSFWMRNTLIPLDMIFIDAEGEIVGIVHRAEPKTLVSRRVDADSKYVLEVPGGWAEQKAVREGSKVELQGVSMLDVR